MTYLQARTRAFEQELKSSMFGSFIYYKDKQIACVSGSRPQEKQMEHGGYVARKTCQVDVRVNDFINSGITLRAVVVIDDVKFEVVSIQDDPKEPFVRLNCNRLQ